MNIKVKNFLKYSLRIAIVGIITILIACQSDKRSPGRIELPVKKELTDRVARDLIVETKTDIGIKTASGTFHVKKSKEYLTMYPKVFYNGVNIPHQMTILLSNFIGELFQYPIKIGETWHAKEQRRIKSPVTLIQNEQVTTSMGTFEECIRHKSVYTDANMMSEVKNSLLNGVRYLWFAKGIGIVKMRYEHSNGVITEAELIDYKIDQNSKDFFPINKGISWTYKWQNNYFKESTIEEITVSNQNSYGDMTRYLLDTKVIETTAEDVGSGSFFIEKTNKNLRVSTSQMTSVSDEYILSNKSHFPYTTSMLLLQVCSGEPEKGLFQYPLNLGKKWKQTNQMYWTTQEEISYEGYESINVSSGTFEDSLLHKTILSNTNVEIHFERSQDTELRLFNEAMINGVRYLWFAKGVGIVKMRYEHSNGIITEAELVEYHVPEKSEDYLPLTLGTRWKYKWKNDLYKHPMFETIEVVRPGGGNETHIEKSNYTISMDEGNIGVLQVNAELFPKKSELRKVRLALNGEGTYIEKVNLSHSPMSSRQPGTRELWTFKSDDLYTIPITLRYTASLRHGSEKNDSVFQQTGIKPNPAITPYQREDCIFFPCNMLFIVGRECNDITVEFNLPKGWHVSTPWHSIGKRGKKFHLYNQNELTTPHILIGKHDVVNVESGETKIILAIGSKFNKSKSIMEDTIFKFIQSYSNLFGVSPMEPVLFIINPYENSYEDRYGKRSQGHSIGRSMSILMDKPLDVSRSHQWGPFLAHEVFHIWNGMTALDNFSGKEHWFKEGVTNFYQDITATRLGYISVDEYLRRLELAWESYLSAPSEFAISDTLDRRLQYNGGSLVTAALDFEIRELSDNTMSFDDVIRRMYQKFRFISSGYTNSDIIEILNDLTGKDFSPFFNTYIYGNARTSLAQYFDNAGLSVNINMNKELPTSDYVIEMLQTNMGRDTPVDVSAINNIRINKRKELQKLAKDWKIGTELEISYGEYNSYNKDITETIVLTEIPDIILTSKEIVVNITKMTEMTEKQRVIFENLLPNK